MATKIKKPKPAKLEPQQVEGILRGNAAAALRKQVTPKQWKKIVARAKQHGVTVESFISGTPGPLQERTRSGIAAEAKKTIATSYKPVYADLTDQEKRVNAINDKRTTDNQYYLNWLNTQTAKLNEGAKTADQALVDRQKGLQDEIHAGYQGLASQLASAAGERPGAVTNPAQNTQTAAAVAGGQGRSELLLQGERTRTDQAVANNSKSQDFMAANNFAQVAASDAKRSADTWKALSDIGDERHKATLSQAADQAKEVERLLSQEIDKANANRNYDAAAQKLGVTTALGQQKLKQSDINNKRNNDTSTRNHDTPSANAILTDQRERDKQRDKQRIKAAADAKKEAQRQQKYNAGFNKNFNDKFNKGWDTLAGNTTRTWVHNHPQQATANLVKAGIPSDIAHKVVNAYGRRNQPAKAPVGTNEKGGTGRQT